MAIDPVCEMECAPDTAAASSEYKGQTYYFCAPGCKTAFDRDPEKYLREVCDEQEQHHDHHGHHCC